MSVLQNDLNDLLTYVDSITGSAHLKGLIYKSFIAGAHSCVGEFLDHCDPIVSLNVIRTIDDLRTPGVKK